MINLTCGKVYTGLPLNYVPFEERSSQISFGGHCDEAVCFKPCTKCKESKTSSQAVPQSVVFVGTECSEGTAIAQIALELLTRDAVYELRHVLLESDGHHYQLKDFDYYFPSEFFKSVTMESKSH